jgi:hypothetical protein
MLPKTDVNGEGAERTRELVMVYVRTSLWSKRGVFAGLFEVLQRKNII